MLNLGKQAKETTLEATSASSRAEAGGVPLDP